MGPTGVLPPSLLRTMPEAAWADVLIIGLDRGEAMSNPDSAQRRRPPTIDLTAKGDETGRPADEAEIVYGIRCKRGQQHRTRQPERARFQSPAPGRKTPYIVGGLIGAAAGAAIIVGLWFAGLAPQGWSAAPQRAATSPPRAAPPNSKRMSENRGISSTNCEQPRKRRLPDGGLTPRIANVRNADESVERCDRGANPPRR